MTGGVDDGVDAWVKRMLPGVQQQMCKTHRFTGDLSAAADPSSPFASRLPCGMLLDELKLTSGSRRRRQALDKTNHWRAPPAPP